MGRLLSRKHTHKFTRGIHTVTKQPERYRKWDNLTNVYLLPSSFRSQKKAGFSQTTLYLKKKEMVAKANHFIYGLLDVRSVWGISLIT